MLKEWLKAGKRTGNEQPETVQAMSPLLQGFKPDTFRRALNQLKKTLHLGSGESKDIGFVIHK